MLDQTQLFEAIKAEIMSREQDTRWYIRVEKAGSGNIDIEIVPEDSAGPECEDWHVLSRATVLALTQDLQDAWTDDPSAKLTGNITRGE